MNNLYKKQCSFTYVDIRPLGNHTQLKSHTPSKSKGHTLSSFSQTLGIPIRGTFYYSGDSLPRQATHQDMHLPGFSVTLNQRHSGGHSRVSTIPAVSLSLSLPSLILIHDASDTQTLLLPPHPVYSSGISAHYNDNRRLSVREREREPAGSTHSRTQSSPLPTCSYSIKYIASPKTPVCLCVAP